MKKVITISLAILMLLSNVGLTMATHICGGHAMSTELMLGHGDMSCGMMEVEVPCSNDEMPMLNKTKCCDNEYLALTIADDFKTPVKQLDELDVQFLIAFTSTYLDLISFDLDADSKYQNYTPPLLTSDIPVSVQSFLI